MASEVSKNSLRPLAVTAILLAVIMFVFPLAIRFPLLDPDEGLHASIAQEMVERGDWITPRLFGEPFLDKPVLYFWVAGRCRSGCWGQARRPCGCPA